MVNQTDTGQHLRQIADMLLLNGTLTECPGLVHRIALNLIKHEQSKKRSVKGKRLDTGWDNGYLPE